MSASRVVCDVCNVANRRVDSQSVRENYLILWHLWLNIRSVLVPNLKVVLPGFIPALQQPNGPRRKRDWHTGLAV
jgi:hypothetical protein